MIDHNDDIEVHSEDILPLTEKRAPDWSELLKGRNGKGFVPHVSDPKDYPVEGRHVGFNYTVAPVGNLLPPGAEIPEHVQLKTAKIRDQKATSMCVAFSFARHINHTLARLANLPPDQVVYPSEPGIYGVTREDDEMDDKGNFMVDGGLIPRMAATKMMLHGVVSDQRLPFSQATVNKALPWDVIQAGFDAKVKKYHFVPAAQGRETAFLDELHRLIASGYTIPFAQVVDQAFEDYDANSAPIRPVSGKDFGGHYTLLTGYDKKSRTFLADNSWSTSWGVLGKYEISEEKLVSEDCSDFMVLTVVPDARNVR